MKQESIIIDKKTTFDLKAASERLHMAGTLVIVGAASAVGICLFLFWKHPVSPFAQAISFFVAGLLHVLIIRRGQHPMVTAGGWTGTLVATGMILALLGGSFLWGPELPFYLTIGCAAAFLLPFTLLEMWRAHLQLALDGARIWHPTTEMLSNYPAFYFNSTRMRFRVLQGKGRPNVTLKFKVSNEMPLGKIFYDLVQNKLNRAGKEIVLEDGSKNPYGWIFFTTDGLVLTRPLDPEKTLYENGLHDRKLVYAQQLSPGDFGNLNKSPNE